MATLTCLSTSVNPDLAPLALPTPAESLLADRFAFEADGGDLDAYRPDWNDDALDLGAALDRELMLAGTFFPVEPDALDLDALSWFEQVEEDAHFADMADEAECYALMMAGF